MAGAPPASAVAQRDEGHLSSLCAFAALPSSTAGERLPQLGWSPARTKDQAPDAMSKRAPRPSSRRRKAAQPIGFSMNHSW